MVRSSVARDFHSRTGGASKLSVMICCAIAPSAILQSDFSTVSMDLFGEPLKYLVERVESSRCETIINFALLLFYLSLA